MPSKIEKLIVKRTIAYARLRETYVLAKEAVTDPSKHLLLKAHISTLDDNYAEYKKIHNEVIMLLDPDVEDAEPVFLEHDKQRYLADNKYYETKALCLQVFPEEKQEVSAQSLSGNLTATSNLRLPKLQIKVFNGELRSWPQFYDLYQALVHNSGTLTNIEKFHYLASVLEGEPLSLVKAIPLTEANYAIAFSTLVNRYQNTRHLATAYYNEIFNAPTMQKRNPKELRSLLNTFRENIAALKALGFPTEEWNFILFQQLSKKVDGQTRTEFELKHSNIEMPSYTQLYEELDSICKAFESMELSTCSVTKACPTEQVRLHRKGYSFITSPSQSPLACVICSASHTMQNCPVFLSKSVGDRCELVKTHKRCLNCLAISHTYFNCKSKSRCRICNKKHHTLLHRTQPITTSASSGRGSSEQLVCEPNIPVTQSENILACTSVTFPASSTVLLSTAKVHVKDHWGNYQKVRVLFDSGSSANFISRKCIQRLGLKYNPTSMAIEGLNSTTISNILGITQCHMKPIDQMNPSFDFEAIVIPNICAEQPRAKFAISNWSHIRHLKLADDQCNFPTAIDLLIGCELLPYIYTQNRIFGNPSEPVALETVFGWTLQGRMSAASCPKSTTLFVSHSLPNDPISNLVEKFWKIEGIESEPYQSPDDLQCEKIYASTVTRDSTGRFIVNLPLRSSNPQFGDTHSQALRRLYSLEKRLLAKPEIRVEYAAFMADYIESKHMSEVDPNDFNSELAYYIPHSYVLKPDSTTTRLRVVFDASAKGSLDKSLNDELLTGMKLQSDIFTILLNFRRSPVAFTCDIKQMYRQILVAPEHRNLQRILWRFLPSEPVKEYRLNTVTYGLSASPFLALRTLIELANQEGSRFALAANVIHSNIYVDDIVVSAWNLDEALKLKSQLVAIFALAGFVLRKWTSNRQALLDEISPEEQTTITFDKEEPQFIKVLGLHWNPVTDVFSYSVNPATNECTKRSILATAARIYDPTGFITPVILIAKHLLQKLWALKSAWDDRPPTEICESWEKFKNELPLLRNVKIPRCILTDKCTRLELHGFCDASQMAYGAVVYFRAEHASGSITTHICAAKSKVAPMKTVSIPRLELLGAVLLTDLITKVTQNATYDFVKTLAWCDSEVVLCWIASPPNKWKTFVANRVSHIQDTLPISNWRFVNTSDNPADIASRGMSPSQICDNVQWWQGPSWLSEPSGTWPVQPPRTFTSDGTLSETQVSSRLAHEIDPHPLVKLLETYSSLRKILGIISYMLRFGCRTTPVQYHSLETSQYELDNALIVLVIHVQKECFPELIDALKKGKRVPNPYRKLSPFLDNRGSVRVGGRLMLSQLEFDSKHPLLLPSRHLLTDRIIEDTHFRNLHPGYKTLSYLLLQQFWILSPRRAIQRCLSQCYRCFRANPKSLSPVMANLPACRINQVCAFTAVCIDYAGPFLITLSKSRGVKSTKAYICLFVCCSTRAIHLELVSDLTSDCFIAALHRFISRRGGCSDIYSDQGTNFIGANRLLHSIAQNAGAQLKIKWHFNPPAAPHFNGLAEAGVKSVKTHLRRVIGDQIMTFEEFYTLLTRVEAVLNSRPLCPLSSDPNDLQPLTPGHFLTLQPLNSPVPESDISSQPTNRLTRWQLLQRMHQHFWQRWHAEYLHTLQQRAKWNSSTDSLSVDQLVVVKNDQRPPKDWELARVVQVHPGADGVIRVATLRGANGMFQRALVKLCPLPAN